MRQTLNAREASLAEREKEVKRTSIELTSQLRSSEAKVKSIEEREARLQELEKSFDSKRTSMLKKEKELELKDSELRLKGEQVEATHSTGADATRIRELKEWEKKILAKEKELGKQEVELRTMETRLKERYENATRIEKQFQGQRRMFDDRESEYVSREKKIADQEAAVRERSGESERQAAAVEEDQHQLDGRGWTFDLGGPRQQGRLLVGDLFLPGDVLRLAVVEHPPLTLELLLDPSRVLVPLLEPGLHRPQLDLLLPEFLLLREDLLFPFFQLANPGRVGSGRMGGLDLLPFQPEFRILQLQLLFLLQHRCTLRVERLLEFLEAGLAFLDRFDVDEFRLQFLGLVFELLLQRLKVGFPAAERALLVIERFPLLLVVLLDQRDLRVVRLQDLPLVDGGRRGDDVKERAGELRR